MKTASGYVTIIGRPNVGKSTLLNLLIGEKLAGVSDKPQTTRGVMRGILTREEGQIVFVDTPGIHDPRDPLGKWMAAEVQKAMDGIDLVYWMVLPGRPDPDDEKILGQLRSLSVPVFLVVNQVDRFPKPAILPVLDHYQKLFAFTELIPISAKTGDQVDVLVRETFRHLPEQPHLFPDDQISDQNERFIVSEMIREKVFRYTGEEIPYAATVVLDNFKEESGERVHIDATIVVERDTQKAIVIGKGGQKIKQIGQAARGDIEQFLGRRVYLELWVKVVPHWRRDPESLKRLGFE